MRIVLVSTRFPLPAWRGQQARTMEWLQALGKDKLICVCPRPGTVGLVDDPALENIRIVTYETGFFGRIDAVVTGCVLGSMPLQEGLYATRAARVALRVALRSERPDLVIIQMVRCSWAEDVIESEAPGTPILFDAIDAMGLHFTRAAETFNPMIRPLARLEAGRCRRREQDLASKAALTVAVAGRDLAALGAPAGCGLAIPVSGKETSAIRDAASAPTILLSGNLGYRPTVEAARWFGSEVWPRVKAAVPEARWVLAGARPARRVSALAALDGVEVYGDVEDLGVFMAQAWVAIAPMASGSGVPMKVLEAWSAGLPVVAHPWTVAGLEVSSRCAVRQAEGAGEWIRALGELLGDREERETLAALGLDAWNRDYHPEVIAERIREAVDTAAGSHRRPV
jgi:transposase